MKWSQPENLAGTSEHSQQKALFAYFALRFDIPETKYMYAIPNGGLRQKGEAGKLKAEGVKAGVPDICLPIPRGGYHGLYLEMKKPGSLTKQRQGATEKQITFLNYLSAQGYACGIFDNWEDARDFILFYLNR